MKVYFRRIIQGLLLIGMGFLVCVMLAGSPQARPALAGALPPVDSGRVDAAVLAALQGGSSTDFVVEFGKQPDLSRAYEINDWAERGRFVVDTLKSNAAKGQARTLAELTRRGFRYRSFFAANEIYVYGGDTPALQALLALPEVARVRAPVTVHLDPAGVLLRPYGPAAPQAQIQSIVDWGITDTKADQFWSTFQSTGQGIVVAGIDTGVDAAHPALAPSYRCAGGILNDPTCWLDATTKCNGQVCDDNGHGTHTMGTMVASNDPALTYTVGMAPGAKWIACKAFTSDGKGTDADLVACADWILAPGGDPALRPQVVNNSWGDTGGNDWFLAAVNAWRAAGIFPAFSAGNSYDCGTLGSPGDYQESFGSAAHSSTRSIASFSSKGPGLFGDLPYTKPNMSAPGQSIRSTYPTTIDPSNPWRYYSGTSMASPHTAGAVALLWACAPILQGQIDATFQLLQSSADPAPAGSCGAPASGQGNYTFGYGYLNVLSAGNQICSAGQINGIVQEAITSNPVEGAEITLTDGINPPQVIHSDAAGNYSLFIRAGNYTAQVKAYGYLPQDINNVMVSEGEITPLDILLTPAPPATVSGTVRDGSGFGQPLSAQLTFSVQGHQLLAQTTAFTGLYSIELFQENEYQVKVEADGYLPALDTIVPTSGELVRDYALLAVPDTCASLGYYRLGGLTQQFESLSLPVGWTITDELANGQVWSFTDPLHIGNQTGAGGGFAQVNSLEYSGSQNTSLISPAMNFSPAQPVVLSFNTNYLHNATTSMVAVDLSLDGGVSWSNLWQLTTQNLTGAVGPIDLTSLAAGKSNVRLRFHYINTYGNINAGRWQIDNVQLSPPPACFALTNQFYLPIISTP